MNNLSMVDIAAQQRHVFLLKKIRANQALSAGELKELKHYEAMKKTGLKKKTDKPAAAKKPTAGQVRRQWLDSLAALAAAAVTIDEAENALGMDPGTLKQKFADDPAAAAVWQKARVGTLVEVKTKLLEQAKDGKPVAAKHIERMLLCELKDGQTDWQRLSTNQTAEAFGVTRQTIHTWFTKHGCPRNADGTYALKELIGWFEKFVLEKNATGTTKTAALNDFQAMKTKRLEMELAERSGQLLKRDTVIAGFLARYQYLVQTCERKLMELAMACEGQSPDKIAVVLKRFFDDLRSGFAQIPDQLRLPAAAAEKLTEVIQLIDP